MKLHYYPETDSLYIELRARPGAETREIAPGLNADFDAAGVIVGLDIDSAASTLDLGTLETVALPLKTGRLATRRPAKPPTPAPARPPR
ncbi:MAG: DUF2283 domain-containing protein [Caulobacteraceae bacterium]|nr:DUF2283 domain-containing protein [Caulobacteraceae bacterium]